MKRILQNTVTIVEVKHILSSLIAHISWITITLLVSIIIVINSVIINTPLKKLDEEGGLKLVQVLSVFTQSCQVHNFFVRLEINFAVILIKLWLCHRPRPSVDGMISVQKLYDESF